MRGIHRSPVNCPHKGQWRGALVFTLICARINGLVNNREAGDLRRYRPHNDVIVMHSIEWYSALEMYHRVCRVAITLLTFLNFAIHLETPLGYTRPGPVLLIWLAKPTLNLWHGYVITPHKTMGCYSLIMIWLPRVSWYPQIHPAFRKMCLTMGRKYRSYKTALRFLESHSYLQSVTAAKRGWHLSNRNVITWINNHTPSNVWDEITYPFPNFNGATVEVW